MKKRMQCNRGHDTSSPDSRSKTHNCKACKSENMSTPESRAYQVAYRIDPVAKGKRTIYDATPERKAQQAAYFSSPKGKARQAAYNASPEGKAQKAAYAANPEVKAKLKAYNDSPEGKADIRRRNLKKQGWTPEAFDSSVVDQGGRCSICSKVLTFGKRGNSMACADHDHNNKRPRGILCGNCNLGIGNLKENPEIMLAAIAYVRKWKEG
jgi:hypothetical protein